MTALEFSNEFDILYNNITSNQAPGLDAYEKSVLLTKAQDEILKSYFNPRLNKTQEGFDDNQRRQIDFSKILKTVKLNTTKASKDGYFNIVLPNDVMLIVNEFITVNRNNTSVELAVIPISYMDWTRLSSKPYKRPKNYQAWRLLDNGNEGTLITGIKDTVYNNAYTLRYVKRPYPIILEELNSDLTINGESLPYNSNTSVLSYVPIMNNAEPSVQETLNGVPLFKQETKIIQHACELDPILHSEIVQRAVELGKAIWAGDLQSQLVLGQNSETNMGIVTQSR